MFSQKAHVVQKFKFLNGIGLSLDRAVSRHADFSRNYVKRMDGDPFYPKFNQKIWIRTNSNPKGPYWAQSGPKLQSYRKNMCWHSFWIWYLNFRFLIRFSGFLMIFERSSLPQASSLRASASASASVFACHQPQPLAHPYPLWSIARGPMIYHIR